MQYGCIGRRNRALVFGETKKRRNVIKGQLVSCSPMFLRMLGGDFKEGTSGEVRIDNVETEAMDLFLDLVEYPRCGSSFESMSVKLRNKFGSISDILDKYDCGSMVPFVKDLVEHSPGILNIVAFEKLKVQNTLPWSDKSIKFIVQTTMTRRLVKGLSIPQFDVTSLSEFSVGTLVQVLDYINKTEFEYSHSSSSQTLIHPAHSSLQIKRAFFMRT